MPKSKSAPPVRGSGDAPDAPNPSSPAVGTTAPVPMPRYRGTKEILARPMTLGDYNAYRGWAMPEGEDPLAAGYLVEYTDGGKANHPDHQGYISWSPADVFERTYLPIVAGDEAPDAPPESDAAFVLRVFGVHPHRFINAGGTLDRKALQASVNDHRAGYAARVQAGDRA